MINHGQFQELHEAWKSRGRELNDLYDEIATLVHPHSTMDPLADLRLIGMELRELRELKQRCEEAEALFNDLEGEW